MNQNDPSSSPRRQRRELLGIALALVIVGALTAAKFHNDFVHDDEAMLRAGVIFDRSQIGSLFSSHTLRLHGEIPTSSFDTYRPISALTFFWDAFLSGEEAWSYHLTNWLLHLTTIALLFCLLRVLIPTAALPVRVFAALFFGLSPQLIEAHVWINGRSDVLAALFGVAALLTNEQASHGLSSSRARGLWWLAAVFVFAGLLSKEVLLMVFPTLLLWPDIEPRRDTPARAWRRMLPFAVAVVAYLALRFQALGGVHASARDGHALRALTHVPLILGDGLSELLWPRRLHLRNLREDFAHVSSVTQLLIATALVGVAVVAWLCRPRAPAALWGISLFAATLSPAAMISAHEARWPGFGRFLYLPAVGLTVALCAWLDATQSWAQRHLSVRARGWLLALSLSLGASYLGVLGSELVDYTRDYADNLTLHRAALAADPRSAAAHAGVAGALASQGDLAHALAEVQRALALAPDEPSYALQVVFFALKTGHDHAAVVAARHAINTFPKDTAAPFRGLLARALARTDPRAALTASCSCLAETPDDRACLSIVQKLADPGATLEEICQRTDHPHTGARF